MDLLRGPGGPTGFDLPDYRDDRPAFAPEIGTKRVKIRRRRQRALSSLEFFAERSVHTGEIVGSIRKRGAPCQN
jgi:hypothetical protein